MANLKEIRSRISSVNSTMQITSAMKMVSAAKLKKAQDAIIAMRPYSEKLTQLLQNLSQNVQDDFQSPFLKNREIRNICALFNLKLESKTDLSVRRCLQGPIDSERICTIRR